jgi:uncharacterized damage-inducible protein DinB
MTKESPQMSLREVLTTLSAHHENAQAPRFFSHILSAQQIWLARIRQENSATIPVWPTRSLSVCRTLVDDLHQQWTKFLDSLTPEKLMEKVTYQNTQGVRFETPLQDILMHVIMHSAYHRGQVATAVRGEGGTPATTDYIAFVRRGL